MGHTHACGKQEGTTGCQHYADVRKCWQAGAASRVGDMAAIGLVSGRREQFQWRSQTVNVPPRHTVNSLLRPCLEVWAVF